MSDTHPNPETRIALFQRKEIRRTIHSNEWWFVITDVIAALTDSGYLKDMRRRDPELVKGWGRIATPLSIATAGGPVHGIQGSVFLGIDHPWDVKNAIRWSPAGRISR